MIRRYYRGDRVRIEFRNELVRNENYCVNRFPRCTFNTAHAIAENDL